MAFPTYTYTFTNGTTADATQVNQNFTDILNGISDTTKDISVNAITAAGTATLNGNLTLGVSSAKTLTINASLSSTLAIGTTNSYDIGAASLGLRSIYLGASGGTTRIVPAASSNWTLTLPATVGTASQWLTTDGAGVANWAFLSVTTKTTTYGAANSDDVILCSSSAFTVTLPTAVGISGKRFQIKKTDSSLTNIITIATTSSQTIDGITTTTLNTQYEALTIVSDGANWQILDRSYQQSWVSFTPTGSWTTLTTYSGKWRRVGDSVQVQIQVTFSGGTGGGASVNLPSNMTIDTAKLVTSTSGQVVLGTGGGGRGGSGQVFFVTYNNTTSVSCGYLQNFTAGYLNPSATAPGTWANGDLINYIFEAPIVGWN